MRKFLAIVVILMSFSFANLAMAAGTVTPSIYRIGYGKSLLVIKLACTAHTDGTVPNTQITEALLNWTDYGFKSNEHYWNMGYYLYEVWTVAGSPAPDAADLTLNDELSSELYTETNVIAASGTTEGYIDKYRLITSKITSVVANQATNGAQWDIYIKLVR